MRTTIALLLTLAAIPAFARWEPCPSACAPPATATGLSVRLPLYAGAVKWGGDTKGQMWLWQKTVAVTCSTKQLTDKSDAFACAAPIGTVMFATPRARQSTARFSVDAPNDLSEIPFTRGTIRHCPMKLPDSSYTAQEREQCRLLDVLNGDVRGPD